MSSGTLGFSGHRDRCEFSPSTNLSVYEGPQAMLGWGCAGGVVQKYGDVGENDGDGGGGHGLADAGSAAHRWGSSETVAP